MHIYDWLNLPAKDEYELYAKASLETMVLPAIERFELSEEDRYPPLFASYKGKRYKVTGASRLGDVWLHEDPTAKDRYTLRVEVEELSYWRKTQIVE